MSEGFRIQPGIYKGRGIAGSEQYGHTSKGNPQIAIDLATNAGRLTTFLYFSDEAAPFSIERLRALGWEGDDLSSLVGIDRHEVDVSVKYDVYQGKQQMKVEILSGGRFVMQQQMDDQAKRQFGASFKALASSMRVGAPRPAAPSGQRPPGPRPAPPPNNGNSYGGAPTDGAPPDDWPGGGDEIPF